MQGPEIHKPKSVDGAAGDLAIVRPAAAAPPKPINLNYAAPDSSAPTLPKGSRDPARKAGRESTPEPSCCFGATPRGGERPRSNRQTTAWPAAPSRARNG